MGKESTCNAEDAGDMGLVPGLEGSPGGGRGNSFQYSCLENPIDIGAWCAIVHKVAKIRTQLKRLSMHAHVQSRLRAKKITMDRQGHK